MSPIENNQIAWLGFPTAYREILNNIDTFFLLPQELQTIVAGQIPPGENPELYITTVSFILKGVLNKKIEPEVVEFYWRKWNTLVDNCIKYPKNSPPYPLRRKTFEEAKSKADMPGLILGTKADHIMPPLIFPRTGQEYSESLLVVAPDSLMNKLIATILSQTSPNLTIYDLLALNPQQVCDLTTSYLRREQRWRNNPNKEKPHTKLDLVLVSDLEQLINENPEAAINLELSTRTGFPEVCLVNMLKPEEHQNYQAYPDSIGSKFISSANGIIKPLPADKNQTMGFNFITKTESGEKTTTCWTLKD